MKKRNKRALQWTMAAMMAVSPVASITLQAQEPTEEFQTESMGTAGHTLNGKPINNIQRPATGNWPNRTTSFLFTTGGAFNRVDHTGSVLNVEIYTSKSELESSFTVALPFGENTILGTVAQTDSDYIVVSGQRNENQDASRPVVCVEKYDRAWNRLASTMISDINTVTPFDAGTCSVSEAGGFIQILTAHQMYKSQDGLNHQASMAFLLDANTLDVKDKMCEVEAHSAYVSHSFTQFIRSNGSSTFTMQLGDAYPRGLVIGRTANDSLEGDRKIAMSIKGEIGDNFTGVTLDGFELSNTSCLSVGTSIDQSTSNSDRSTKNVYLITTDQNDLENKKLTWITSYSAADGVNLSATKLVKMGNNSFKLMWNETRGASTQTKAVDLDGEGNRTGQIETIANGRLAMTKCQPCYSELGGIFWVYSTDDSVKLVQAAEGIEMTMPMHRLYNPNSGEHFYTADDSEKSALVGYGWKYEGTGWNAPEASSTPVYRLYNANAGDHHYTMDVDEKNMLVNVGWKDEGIGWYSDDEKQVPLYRQYNPNAKAGSHNYTVSKKENDALVQLGWKAEGIGWYGKF